LKKRVFTTDESLSATVMLAHFGPDLPPTAEAEWQLKDAQGHIITSGSWGHPAVHPGNDNLLGEIKANLAMVPAPQKLNLTVSLSHTPFANDWDLWVYPPQVDTAAPAGIIVTDQWDARARSALNQGGKVLWLIPPAQVAGDRLGKVGLGFSSIFWNTAWTGRQLPHTLGVLCDPKHPLFHSFPTDFHSNWQWWYLVSRAGAMILDQLPEPLRPTVQVIDDWFTNRKLGLAFEARVGQGKLVVCSIDLNHDLERNPVARQFRHSLLRYMASSKFNPRITLTPDQVQLVGTTSAP